MVFKSGLYLLFFDIIRENVYYIVKDVCKILVVIM